MAPLVPNSQTQITSPILLHKTQKITKITNRMEQQSYQTDTYEPIPPQEKKKKSFMDREILTD